MEKLRSAIFDGGLVKTPMMALAGFGIWSCLKGILEGTVLVATATLVLIHLVNAVIRQWCPLRREVSDCASCPLAHSIFCARCTAEKRDL